jgi:hypothetical protein
MKFTVINSIIATADNIDNVKLYFGIDEDDPTREIVKKMEKSIPFLKVIDLEKTPNEKANIHVMWNICARASTEEIIAMIGDDMIFRTPGWDTEIIRQFEQGPKDNMILVWCNDAHRGEACPVNAFVHRKYMELNNGIFLREEFIANWVDTWLLQIFKALHRTVYLPNYVIEHNHWVFGGRQIDGPGQRLLDRNPNDKSKSDALFAPLEPVRVEEVKKWAKMIGIQPDWRGAGFSQQYWDIKV